MAVTAAADDRLRVTAVADVLLRAAERRTVEVEVDPLTVAAGLRTVVDRRTAAAAVAAAGMEGKNTLDSFPA